MWPFRDHIGPILEGLREPTWKITAVKPCRARTTEDEMDDKQIIEAQRIQIEKLERELDDARAHAADFAAEAEDLRARIETLEREVLAVAKPINRLVAGIALRSIYSDEGGGESRTESIQPVDPNEQNNQPAPSLDGRIEYPDSGGIGTIGDRANKWPLPSSDDGP